MTVRTGVAACVAALTLAGCGGGGADDVLSETASKLGEIRSGTLDMSLLVTPRGDADEFGFELSGPFSFGEAGSLPVMEIEYTQIANGQRGAVTLISTGQRAYARVGEELRELTEAQTEQLRQAAGAVAGDGGLEQFAIDEWIEDADVSDGGEVGGAETDKVSGELDIVETVNGLLGLVRGLGRDAPTIEGESAERLRDATSSTLFEVHTGADDRLLRRLRMEADFGLDVPQELREALGEVVGAKVAFQLGVTDPNQPVQVADPAA